MRRTSPTKHPVAYLMWLALCVLNLAYTPEMSESDRHVSAFALTAALVFAIIPDTLEATGEWWRSRKRSR